MKIEYLQAGILITDLPVAAALLSQRKRNVEFDGLEVADDSRNQFYFKISGDVAMLKNDISRYFSGTLSLPDAKAFSEQLRNLRSLVVSRKNYGHAG